MDTRIARFRGELVSTLEQLVAAVPGPDSPYYLRTGHQLALIDIAHAIRTAVPIAGVGAVDAECAARRQLVDAALAQLGVEPGASHWWTLVCETRPSDRMPVFAGIWAHSREEAVICTVLWRSEFDGRHLCTIEIDEHCEHHAQLSEARRRLQLADERTARRADDIARSLTLF